MTDQLTGLGSVETGNPNGGNGQEQNGSGSQSTATGNEGPQGAGNLDWAKAKGWVGDDGTVKADDVLKGYQSLEKRMGSMVAVPDDKAKPEDVDAFWKKLGYPGDAKGYEFAVPQDLPKEVPYDQATAEWFRETANELKLPKGTATALHDKFVGRMVEVAKGSIEQAATQFEQEIQTKAKTTHEELVKDWGTPGSPEYIQNRDAAVRAANAFPGAVDAFKEAGLLTKDGVFANPNVARMLSQLGKTMQNDTFVGNGTGGNTANPFAKETRNATQSSLLIKSDPQKAATLAAAAGWTPDEITWVKSK
jgi:hypothetical protein